MNTVILDTSAVVAFLQGETGAEVVEPYLQRGLLSSVSYTECLNVLIRKGVPVEDADLAIQKIITEIIAYTPAMARLAASMTKILRPFGISLGDQACLALALHEDLPVLTADRIWQTLDIGVQVVLIR